MFKAILIDRDPQSYRAALTGLDESRLPPGDVTVRVEYSTLNYKDALAITGKAPVVRQFPMIPGIDLAGTVGSVTAPITSGLTIGIRPLFNVNVPNAGLLTGITGTLSLGTASSVSISATGNVSAITAISLSGSDSFTAGSFGTIKTTGSASDHGNLVAQITATGNTGTTKSAVTSVSAAMCRKALLRLRSRRLPEAKRSAVTPLTMIPAAATQITMPLATGIGSLIRRNASQAMPPVTTNKMIVLASETRIELLRSP